MCSFMDGITSRAISGQSEHTEKSEECPPTSGTAACYFLFYGFLLELGLTSVHRRDVNGINSLWSRYTLVNAVQLVQTTSSGNFHAELNSP